MGSINFKGRISTIVVLVFFAVSCSSTRSRINEKPAVFSTLEPQDQMKIQNGDIDIGYTEDMVYMAKGKPKEVEQRQEHGKKILVWRYSRPRYGSGASQSDTGLNSPYGYPQFGPHPSTPTPLFYDGPSYSVEFENGKVRRVAE